MDRRGPGSGARKISKLNQEPGPKPGSLKFQIRNQVRKIFEPGPSPEPGFTGRVETPAHTRFFIKKFNIFSSEFILSVLNGLSKIRSNHKGVVTRYIESLFGLSSWTPCT